MLNPSPTILLRGDKMVEKMKFVRNYSDLSTDTGYQFEFYCDRCGNGFRTKFKPSVTGTVSTVLEGASSLFGGIFSRAAGVGDRVHSAQWERGSDEAFKEATEEIMPFFIQCPHCQGWVCREDCWNVKKGLCKECVPDLGVEMAKAQAERSIQEIHAHACMAEEDKKLGAEYWREGIVASCPNCETPLEANSKFCPECGHKLVSKTQCPACNATVSASAKFCNECGEKLK